MRSCRYDINSIVFYLLSKEWSKIAMILNQVYTAPQKVLKILYCRNVVVESCRHSDKQVHITTFVLFISGNGAKHTHRRDTEKLLQFGCMFFYQVYIFLS